MPRLEAMYQVRLANALTDQGRADLAAKQFTRAVELWGPDGQRKVDALREQLREVEASVPVPMELCRSEPSSPNPSAGSGTG